MKRRILHFAFPATRCKPFEEYQGTVHFSNQKGIRAECADCHIPKSGMDYLFAKLKASKDIYHEFVSGGV
ncbi:NapC/NirT family cytochrome c, partial [Pseudomonas aeruginosa]|uniref:NapC/NirT family cytochrome c n=1 Tax=Pseudomonas aeruginosa TaxID=287 RepID=UPI003D18D829